MQADLEHRADSSSAHLRLEYSSAFQDEKSETIEHLLSRGEANPDDGVNLEGFESCVCVKNIQRNIVHANSAFRRLIASGADLTGASTDTCFSGEIRRLSQITDELILGGVQSIELEHVAEFGGAARYLFITYKRRLDELRDPNLSFLVISRPLRIISEGAQQRRRSLSEQSLVFLRFDEIDQRICRMYYYGESTKTIAETVSLTPRSVEIRRQRMLDAFGFQRPVEIIKLLTLLEEHALIRLMPE